LGNQGFFVAEKKNICYTDEKVCEVKGVQFVKAEGLGNDFVILDGIKHEIPQKIEKLVPELCDRHFGIGADGVLLIENSELADIKMRIINADGSEAQMCGNGIRCVAIYAYRTGLVQKKMKVETLAGILTPEITSEDPFLVCVDMGEPVLERAKIPMLGKGDNCDRLEIEDQKFSITAVSMGNPHCVIFCDNTDGMPEKWGRKLEYHPIFPQKSNIEFVQVLDRNNLRMRVWERGAAITLACGTGACAVLVAGVLKGLCERKARIILDGGELWIEWEEETNHIFMTGPANLVFEGKWLL